MQTACTPESIGEEVQHASDNLGSVAAAIRTLRHPCLPAVQYASVQACMMPESSSFSCPEMPD